MFQAISWSKFLAAITILQWRWHQYVRHLKEKRYYSNIISGNISQEIFPDSIHIDVNEYPFYFRYYEKEKLKGTTSVVKRSLVTEGYLRNVARSDNNLMDF